MKESIKNDKTRIHVNKLKPGMKTAKDVEYDFGGILLPEGTILNKQKINRIQKLNHQYIYIFNESEKKIKTNVKKIKKTESKYKKNMNHMKSAFNRAQDQEEITSEDIQNLTSEITEFENESEMLDLLTKVREVDQYTYSHLLNVGILAYMFGDWINLSEKQRINLTQAGLLHDIGKAKISDQILNKPGQLTKKEYEKIKKHSIYGYKIAQKADFISEDIARGILTHHERYNGTGYPLGLKGNKIPLFGRILSILDTFDAITAERIYKPGCSPFEAIKIFKEDTPGMFDYRLLKIFLDKIPNYFVNEKVLLNNGKKAEVIFINPRHPHKPIIKVNNNYIDLYNNNKLKVKELIQS